MSEPHPQQNSSAPAPAPAPAPVSEPEATRICSSADSASALVRVLDAYLADLQAGRAPDKARLLAEHPELARELDNCLAGIDFVHLAARPNAGTPTHLGDFRIFREVGRGGMGVVYEAEQLSLKRRVALKVLRFGVTADAEVMQRFQREAETVAHLHHTNIVPIHAIGCEQGVHYYAMQFIEGQSLAAVLDEPDRAASVNFREIAGWALQAAEALAHAHQRGVIHRDIKPSNLILDPQGTVWLTDFGLAKRADEVTLTAAGILMGTPRYMSPEQAAAANQPIDHRTDIYSLGATLYELATGKPVFDGQTPQGVITQILNAEPVSPRLLQGKLPRDLETIILKCLAKEPSRRYQQARELADDLRAYLENRAIGARRASLAERAVRWAKHHQRSTTVAVVSAAVSLLLIAGGIAGWSEYRESLNGRLSLTTDGPSLVAEVLNDRDELVTPSFPVPNPQPVVLPAGTHRVRLSGSGQLSETWTVDVERGQQRTHSVKLLDRFLASPLELPGYGPPVWITLNGQSNLFHRVERGWRLTRGDALSPAWSNDLTKFPEKPDDPQHPNTAVWGAPHDLLQTVTWNSVVGETGSAPGVAQPAVDVNGDNRDDLILASRVSPSLVAVSGTDGRVLWWYRALPNFPKDHDAVQDPFNLKATAESAGVIREPIVAQLNGEPVVIAVYVSHSTSLRTQSGKTFTSGRTFYVEAVAARTGKQVWRTVFDLPELPARDVRELVNHFAPRPAIVPLNGKQTVVLHVGTKLFGFDLQAGKEMWPAIDLGARPLQQVQLNDMDGDGTAEALCLFRKDRYSDELFLKAVSVPAGTAAWERPFLCSVFLQRDEVRHPGAEVVWTTDLDADGKTEIVIPVKDDWQQYHQHWMGVEVLDGATGAPRWQSHIRNWGPFGGGGQLGALRLIDGPDLDGDQHRELFVASESNFWRPETDDSPLVQVDALSGRDGRVLWRQKHRISDAFSGTERGRLQWGSFGTDGWPQLVVPVSEGPGRQPITFVLSAGTGRVEHILPEVSDPQVVDVNGDGLPEITHLSGAEGSRRLTVLKGLPPVEWRRPGNWRPAPDFDGDGTPDFLEIRSNDLTSLLTVHCGRDGRVLWQAEVRASYLSTTPVLHLDCNGDGTSDVVLMESCQADSGRTFTVSAISGKEGRRLWTAPPFGFQPSSTGSSGGGPRSDFRYPMLDQRDLDGDGRPEILVAGHIGLMNTVSLAALSNRDGRLLWKVPIINSAFVGQLAVDRHIWNDLNGDGVPDIALWVPQSIGEHEIPIGAEVRAYSGRDGASLWKHGYAGLGGILWPRHAIADLDGDGQPEVLVTSQNPQGNLQSELAVLDGRTGERKWNWSWQRNEDKFWPPLPVDSHGDGRRVICLAVHEPGPSGNIMVFDAQGEVRQRLPIASVYQTSPWMALDVDGDRREELLYVSERQLQACRLADQKTLWKQSYGSDWPQIAELRTGPNEPRMLVGWSNRTAAGIEPRTGDVKWRCDVAKPDNYQFVADLSHSADVERPLVVSHDAHSQTTLVQRVWPTNADGAYQSPQPAPINFPPFVAPVRYRRLPWVRSVASLNPLRVMHEESRHSGWPKILLALLEWPVFLVFVTASLRWLSRQQWKPLLAYWLLLCVLAAGIAALSLYQNSYWLEADERFSWDGWYWILWGGGALPLGALTLVALAGIWLVKGIRRAIVRKRAA